MKHFYTSKKLWAAVIGAVVAFAKAYGIAIPEEILWVIISYIVGQGIADVGVGLANSKKIGLALPQPSMGLPSVSDTVVIPEPTVDEQMPKPTTATMLFKAEWSKPYILTNTDNPAQVEADYVGHFETVLELAKRMFEEQRGYYPEQGIEDPCRTGDWTYESRWLYHSQRELVIQKDMVTAIKKNRSMGYQLGGLGYLLQGVKWNNMPEWARLSVMEHVK